MREVQKGGGQDILFFQGLHRNDGHDDNVFFRFSFTSFFETEAKAKGEGCHGTVSR